MGLSNRKEKILGAVVSNYIDNCQPVSSLELHDRYLPQYSSATIRSELSALEEMGYLTQPHISAGRIPTAEAYRLYVDKLLPKKKLSKAELKTIKGYFNQRAGAIEEMVKNTAKVISQITNLTAVGYVKHQKNDAIKSISIVKISEDLALFVIVTDRTVLKDATVKINSEADEKYFKDASVFMTALFKGQLISEVIQAEKFAKKIRREYEKVYDAVIKILKNYGETGLENISIEGASKILEQPEYSNIKKAKAMLELFDTKEQLYPILQNSDMDINIKIGRDDEISKGLPECAIITASYSIDGVEIGNAGVIGPIRMDYSKVISVLDFVGKTIVSSVKDNLDNDYTDKAEEE